MSQSRFMAALAAFAFSTTAAAAAQSEPPGAAREALAKLARELKIGPGDFVLSRAEFQAPKNPGTSGTWYVAYRQNYRGLPVFGASVRFVVSGNKVVSTRANAYPAIDRSIEPQVTLAAALQAIAPPGTTPVSVQLGIAPRAEGKRMVHHLAWQIVLPIEKQADARGQLVPVQWRYLVDADTRAILERVDMGFTEDVSGTVTGSIRPTVPADAPVVVPIRNMTVRIRQGAVEPFAATSAAGAYNVTGLAAGPAFLSARLWGPNIVVFNMEAPPGSSHTAMVTVPATHDWDWTAFDVSAGQVETNAFHHANVVRNWFLRGTPFDVEAAPLPVPPALPLTVQVRAGPFCQSGYLSSGPTMYFGSGRPGMCLDHGQCADIIYHEYTHGVVEAVYAGSGVDLRSVPEGGAMHEGWADFFSVSITGNPAQGAGCGVARDIDSPDRRYPGDLAIDPHVSGMIFSGALWDLRAVLAADYVDSLAIRAMKRNPASFSDYLAALLEEDDNPAYSTDPASANNNPADGTPNIDAICRAYYDLHGIYHPYCGGHTSTMIALLTAPPSRTYTLLPAAATTLTVEGTAEAGSASPLSAYVIEYAVESAPTTWIATGVTLAGGGTSPVAGGVLGTISLAGLGDGMYRVRLTVTDAAGGTAIAKGTFFVDRAIKPNWPQARGVHFYGTPAVANIDPAYPGLEIIAPAYPDGMLYAWHADGTPVMGWPQSVGLTQHASPAVADLDGDGTLEIVMATTLGNVYVFTGRGRLVPPWPRMVMGGIPGTAALADLDGDGTLEIIVAGNTQVFAWHADGTPVMGFPVTPGVNMYSSVAVGDIDNDGLPEIFIGAQDGRVYGWNGRGIPLAGWPQPIPGAAYATPGIAIGDLDGDGRAEIIAIGSTFTPGAAAGSVIAWHGSGARVMGWPRSLTQPVSGSGSVSLADVDGMGLKVVVLSDDNVIQIFGPDGAPLPTWVRPAPVGTESFPSSPSIADLDGDGTMEVVAERAGLPFDGVDTNKVYAFRRNGSVVPGWPKHIAGAPGTSPVIADIDGDGRADIVVGADGMFAWTVPGMPGTWDRQGAEWPNYRQGNRRTGAYVPRAGVALLFDVSGSMEWGPTGTVGVPVGERRITLAKNAAKPFVEELNDFNSGKARFGIATFPGIPTALSCDASAAMQMVVVNDASKDRAVLTVIPGLTTDNSTPMLVGIRRAARMLEEYRSPALVLLTDGYHNCPSLATLGDPEVTALIARLNEYAIRLFSIGFGRATDPDYVLLQGLADRTTPAGSGVSQFHDVTTPGFDPATWTPATALQSTYKTILVDALGLQAAVDPLAVIAAGARRTHTVHLNEHDRRVSFFLSWKLAQQGRLTLTVKASDGSVVAAPAAGVRVHRGDTYSIVTVDATYLRLAGKVGAAPWTMQVDATGVPVPGSEPYQYSVITDSALRFDAGLDGRKWLPARKLLLTARLTEDGRLVRGRPDVFVDVTRPRESIDQWLARHSVSAAELRRVPEKIGGEPLSPRQRKAIYLQDIRKVKPPRPLFGQSLKLRDDGTHGDVKAGDGIYSAEIAAPNAGVYSFHFHASGRTAAGLGFERDRVMQKYVTDSR